MTIEEAVRAHVFATLEKHGGNRTQAAKELGIARQSLQRLIAKWRDSLPSPA